MKPIIGEVVSSTPVSLAEAASILSNFISKGTGATQEMSAYLARTRAAFDELVEYHRHSKLRRGASSREEVIKEEKQNSKVLKEEAFEGRGPVSRDKTALRVVRSDGNGHVDARLDGEGTMDEKSYKKKRKKHREHEVDSGAQAARSKLAGDNVKGEDPEGRDSRKKQKKRDRQVEGGSSNMSISDVDIGQPPKKKKKREKVIEYEVEVERNVHFH